MEGGLCVVRKIRLFIFRHGFEFLAATLAKCKSARIGGLMGRAFKPSTATYACYPLFARYSRYSQGVRIDGEKLTLAEVVRDQAPVSARPASCRMDPAPTSALRSAVTSRLMRSTEYARARLVTDGARRRQDSNLHPNLIASSERRLGELHPFAGFTCCRLAVSQDRRLLTESSPASVASASVGRNGLRRFQYLIDI